MMLKHATGTVLARLFITGMNLLVMMLAGHALGAEGLGTIGLIVLGITLVMLPANLIGGGAMVYLVPRVPLGRLLPPAYVCAMVSAAGSYLVLRKVPLVPDGFEGHVCALACIQAVYSAHFGVLLGRERIAAHNAINAIHSVVLLSAFALLLRFRNGSDALAYVYACYAAFTLSAVLSSAAMGRSVPVKLTNRHDVARMLLRQGFWVQGANGLQLMNYRLAYWIVEHTLGRAALGMYSVGTQLAESAWIAPRSLGMVLVSRVSNLEEVARQRDLTLLTAKAAVGVALGVILVLAMLPDTVFGIIFGKGITGLRPIVLLLAPGILSMSASQAFSHYFSGKGQNRHNLVGSGLGMFITAGLGWWAIQHWGLKGAALTASLAYTTSLLYQWAVFSRRHAVSWHALRPTRADMDRVSGLLRMKSRPHQERS